MNVWCICNKPPYWRSIYLTKPVFVIYFRFSGCNAKAYAHTQQIQQITWVLCWVRAISLSKLSYMRSNSIPPCSTKDLLRITTEESITKLWPISLTHLLIALCAILLTIASLQQAMTNWFNRDFERKCSRRYHSDEDGENLLHKTVTSSPGNGWLRGPAAPARLLLIAPTVYWAVRGNARSLENENVEAWFSDSRRHGPRSRV